MAAGSESNAFADSCAEHWRDVHAALAPIIGSGGVDALYKRCLFLRRVDYPWLSEVGAHSTPGDFAGLCTAISAQPEAEARAANGALVETLRQLLTNLIGASLTGQLLQSVWIKFGHAVRT